MKTVDLFNTPNCDPGNQFHFTERFIFKNSIAEFLQLEAGAEDLGRTQVR